MTNSAGRAFISDVIAGDINHERTSADKHIQKILHAVRKHLGLDVAFVSQFVGGLRVFRFVDSPKRNSPIQVGGADPLEDSYCQRVVDGRLPSLIQDASQLPAALDLPVTSALPVGAHLSIPIILSDDTVFGTFCCFGFKPDYSLNNRDLEIVRVFADIVADQVERDLAMTRRKSDILARVQSVLESDSLSAVFQPIYDIANNRIVGFESLARFNVTPSQTPDAWFSEAAEVSLGIPLELKAVRLGLTGIAHLPSNVYVAVNVSPETILKGNLEDVLNTWPLNRIILEVTEHSAIDHYHKIAAVLTPLRKQGLRLAIDDTGAGYASFRHILSLAPDVIKLDMSITRNIDSDFSRRALATAFVSFAQATGSRIVAEGVETTSELDALQELGIIAVQGYLLGKPMAPADAFKLVT
jgi:EAL domain-containing protein (putative c-di-GMP-specific phosphodiesterase class I)